jgi:peptide/nickel transport system permease protein
MAGQWKLMWWRFRRHRPAVVSAIFLALIYFTTAISEFIAPYDLAHAAFGLHLRAAAAGSM